MDLPIPSLEIHLGLVMNAHYRMIKTPVTLCVAAPITGVPMAVCALAEYTNFCSRLKTLDAFLDAALFLNLMGIAIAAGGLLSVAADQKRQSATKKYETADANNLDPERELALARKDARSIASGASCFMLAFFPALLGLLDCIALDAVVVTPTGEEKLPAVIHGLTEVWGSSLKAQLIETMLSGGFLGAAILLMLQGFYDSIKAFAVR